MLEGHKTASRDFSEPFGVFVSVEPVQVVGRHQVELHITTKTASGVSEWLSRDPLGEAGGFNLYAFVLNDPVNNWDYLGLLNPKEYQDVTQANAIAIDIINEFGGQVQGADQILEDELTTSFFGLSNPDFSFWFTPDSPKIRLRNQYPGQPDDDIALLEATRINTSRARVLLGQNGQLSMAEINRLRMKPIGTLVGGIVETGLALAPYSKGAQIASRAVMQIEGAFSQMFGGALAKRSANRFAVQGTQGRGLTISPGIQRWANQRGSILNPFSKSAPRSLLTRPQIINQADSALAPLARQFSDARVGFRGSLARGTKGRHKKGAPFDPSDFDVDALVVSDDLAALVPKNANGFRNLARLPEHRGLVVSAGTWLREGAGRGVTV